MGHIAMTVLLVRLKSMRNATVSGVMKMKPNDDTRRISGDFTKKSNSGGNNKW